MVSLGAASGGATSGEALPLQFAVELIQQGGIDPFAAAQPAFASEVADRRTGLRSLDAVDAGAIVAEEFQQLLGTADLRVDPGRLDRKSVV